MSAEELRLQQRVEELENELKKRGSSRSRSRSKSHSSAKRISRDTSQLFADTKFAVRDLEVAQPKYFQSERMGFSVCSETGGITGTVLDRIGRVRTVGARPKKIIYNKDQFEDMIAQMVHAYRWQSLQFSQPSVVENMKPVILPFLESVLHESNVEWLKELHSDKKRRYNPNGFHVIEVVKVAAGDANTDFSVRLHLYEPLVMGQTESVHAHKWHLESMILTGTFRHLLYDSPGIEEQSWENTFLKWQRKKEGLRKNFSQMLGEPEVLPSQKKDQEGEEPYWFTPQLQEDSLSRSTICREKEHDRKNFPRYWAGVAYRTERKTFRETQFVRLADHAIDLVKFADREEKPGNYYFLDARIPHRVVASETPPCTFVITHPVGQDRLDGWKFMAPYDLSTETRHVFDGKSSDQKQPIFDELQRELERQQEETLVIADSMTLESFRMRLEALFREVQKNFPRGTGSQQQVDE